MGYCKKLNFGLIEGNFYLASVLLCSANVLLDLSFRAKVGDFGLARAIGGEHAQMASAQTVRVVGTSGYIAPEYFRGTITTKLDTYAFGVVRDLQYLSIGSLHATIFFLQILLELMTGLPSYDERRSKYTDLVRCCMFFLYCNCLMMLMLYILCRYHTWM